MFRIDRKTGQLLDDDHCHTATVPHKLAKRRNRTGNYGLANEARESFAHLILPTDPVTGKPQFPIPCGEGQDEIVRVKIPIPLTNEVDELRKVVPVKKLPDLEGGEPLWNSYDEVVALLCSGTGTDPADYCPIRFGSTVTTVSSFSSSVSSFSDDSYESAAEDEVVEEAIQELFKDEDVFENLTADVVPVPDVEEDDEPEDDKSKLGAVGGKEKDKKKKKKKGEVEHDPFVTVKELDFRDMYRKEFHRYFGRMFGDNSKLENPYVDYYFEGEEELEEEFYLLEEILQFEDLQRGHVRLFDDELDY